MSTVPDMLLLLLCLYAQFTSSGCSATFFDHSDTAYYDTVHLRDVTPRALRNKRSAEGMPDHLHLKFKSGSHVVSLRLRRSENIDVGKLPVYSVGDSQRPVKVDLPFSVDTAVYRDTKNGAAVLVRKSQNNGVGLELHGSLQIGDKDFTISPTEALPRFSSDKPKLLQVLRAVKNPEDFELDYVEPEDESEHFITDKARTKTNNVLRSFIKYKRSSGWQRPTRQAGIDRRNVEINIVCDYCCYKNFLERQGNNATLALDAAKLYYSYMAQALDVRYRTISIQRPDVLITVTPLSVIVATTAGGASYSEKNRVGEDGVNGNQLLRDFRSWAADTGLQPSATNILFTGYNMMLRGQTSGGRQLGIGYIGTACGFSGVVVAEEKYQPTTAMIAAHELGHNLNSKHDGVYRDSDSNCDNDNPRYVMSAYISFPVGSSNPWMFSPCSSDAIVKFITVTKSSCFRDNYVDKVPDDEGQVYDADDQCYFALGQEAYFCRGRQTGAQGFNDLCTRMYCSATPTENDTCVSIIAREFTSCGDQKWCVRGQCVFDTRAPTKSSDTCAQGDDPTYGCRLSTCGNSLARDIFCCQTCAWALNPTARTTTSTQRLTVASTKRLTVPTSASQTSVQTQRPGVFNYRNSEVSTHRGPQIRP